MNYDHDIGQIEGLNTIDTTIVNPKIDTPTNSLYIVGTGALKLPLGLVGERPTGIAGLIRYNTSASIVEFHNGSSWIGVAAVGSGVTSVAATGSTGLSVTGSPITSSGTLAFTLDTGLQNLSALAGTGLVVQTSADVYSTRTITGAAGLVDVTNGNGVAGNPVVTLATVSQAASGTFSKVTLDSYGRVTGNTAVTAGDITPLVNSTYVKLAGDTMTSGASITFSGGGEIRGLPSIPSTDTAAASKYYVDQVATGLSWKQSVAVGTTAPITLSGTQTIDGVAVVAGTRVLVKDQASTPTNGIYVVAAGAWTRATDMDGISPRNEINGAAVFVELGSTNGDTGWVQTSNVTTLGTDPVTFSQFSGTGTYQAGNGLTLSGNIFSITSPVAPTLGGTGTSVAPTAGKILIGTSGGTYASASVTAGAGITITPGSGTLTIANSGVTSVGLSLPAIFTVTGSPVTTTGTLTAALATQAPNTVLAGPATGGAAVPTFRALNATDIAAALVLYKENPSSPTAPVASGTNAVAIGSGAKAIATSSTAIGLGANANTAGQFSTAYGSFAAPGDAQTGLYTARCVTTNNTYTQLFLDGSSLQFIPTNNSVYTFDILVAAKRTDAAGEGAGYRGVGVLTKGTTAGSIDFIGKPSKTNIGETTTAWDFRMSLDLTTGALKLEVRGETGNTVRWVASITTAEVLSA